MSALASRLYLRIWLAVVAAVVLLTLAAAWAWRASREATAPEPPTREIVLRNQAGEVIASAQAAPERRPGQPRCPLSGILCTVMPSQSSTSGWP